MWGQNQFEYNLKSLKTSLNMKMTSNMKTNSNMKTTTNMKTASNVKTLLIMNSTSIMKTVSNRPNQTYYTTKPTKPNHEINPNKPTRPNLLNKTYQNKTTKTYKHKYALCLALGTAQPQLVKVINVLHVKVTTVCFFGQNWNTPDTNKLEHWCSILFNISVQTFRK